MKKIKKPYLISILLTLLVISAPVISGVIISVAQLKDTRAVIVQAAAFFLVFILGCVISKSLFGEFGQVGLKEIKIDNYKRYLWFLPIIAIEIIPLFFGLKSGFKLSVVIIYLLFTISVGLAEELYFRGIIARVLKQKGLFTVIILTSLLFSAGHLFNLLAGAKLMDTLLQILFAFVFGAVAVQISISTGSIIIPIIWHIIHNSIAMGTVGNTGMANMITGSIQVLVLTLYAIYLWIMVMNEKEVIKTTI